MDCFTVFLADYIELNTENKVNDVTLQFILAINYLLLGESSADGSGLLRSEVNRKELLTSVLLSKLLCKITHKEGVM